MKEKVFRKLFLTIHRWLGLISGLVVCLLCLSGALFVFAEELMHWYNKEHLEVEARGQRMPVDALYANYKAHFPQETFYWINAYADPNRSFSVLSGISSPEEAKKFLKITFLNPYTGQIIAEDRQSANFFYLVAHFHSELLLDDLGNWIIRIATIIFLIEIIFGLVLWWPKGKNGKKAALLPKYPATAKRINYDLHRVYGFYGCWLLLISIGTGLIMSFEELQKPTVNFFGGNSALIGQNRPTLPYEADKGLVSMEKIYTDFLKTYPANYKIAFYALNNDTTTTQELLLDTDDHFLHLYGTNRVINRYDGLPLHHSSAADFQANQEILEFNEGLHMGSLGGLFTKILALLTGLFGASLPITGFCIWWGRKRIKSKDSKSIRGKKNESFVHV